MSDYEDYCDIPDEEQVEWCKIYLAPIVGALDAKVRHHPDDEELHCTGRLDGRPFKIDIDTDGGSIEVYVKVTHPHGEFILNRDLDEEDDGLPPEEPDEDWEADNDVKHFVAKHIYMDDDPSTIEEWKRTFASIGPAADRLVALMQTRKLDFVSLEEDVLEADYDEDVMTVPADSVVELVRELADIASMIEK